MDRTAYAYIVARLRALETRLISAGFVERMIDADSANEAFRSLNDLSFLSGCMGEYTVNEFQSVLAKGLQKMLRLFNRMAPHPEVVNFLNLKYDFHNLKIALKAYLTKKNFADVSHALLDVGSFSKDRWEEFVLEGTVPPLTDGMQKTLNEVNVEYEKNEDPQIVDMLVDKHYVEEMLVLAKKMDSDMVIGYLKKLIDLTNLRSFIRCKELDKKETYFESVLMFGGNTDTNAFTKNYKKGYEDLRSTLEKKMYGSGLVEALDEFIREKSLFLVEKKASELLQEFMKESNRIAFGPEPVFTFFWKFENHMQILRTILVGKLNQLPTEEIREHVLII